MPRWFRVPKGTYTRDTRDWFSHQRAYAGVQFNPTHITGYENNTPAFGLVNSGTPTVYLHVTAIRFSLDGDPSGGGSPPLPPNPFASQTFFLRQQGNIQPVEDPNNAIWGPGVPLYSNDPMPPGSSVAGWSQDATFLEPLFFNPVNQNGIMNETVEGLVSDICVVAPNSTLEIYQQAYYFGMFVFEYYWLTE